VGTRHCIDKLAGDRGNSTQPLQEIQNHPLAGKNHAGVMTNDRYRLALVQAHPVENFGMSGDFIVRGDGAVEVGVDVKNAGDAANAGESAILLGKHGARRALVGIDAGIAGGIARGPVFLQRVLDNGGDASAIPVHG